VEGISLFQHWNSSTRHISSIRREWDIHWQNHWPTWYCLAPFWHSTCCPTQNTLIPNEKQGVYAGQDN
jgi:hypothetical protein